MINALLNNKGWTPTLTAIFDSLLEKGGQTIAEMSASMGVSVPYATKSLNELIDMGLVQEVGKRSNYARRAPKIYSLVGKSAYFLGIDTGHDRLNLAITDFCGNVVFSKCKIPYEYDNSEKCFNALTDKVNTFIDESGVPRSEMAAACMSVGGRVNPVEGKSHSCFTCLDGTLADALTHNLGIVSSIDNDTRCMLYGEYMKGCCRGYKDVVFVNISWGLGIGIIIDGKIYQGKSGYSGEIGHMHIYRNGLICHCGKTGCMETEASGSALQRKMTQALADGAVSILTESYNSTHELPLLDIIDAIEREDVLSIDKLQEVAVELGINLAGVINMFNPEILVIGGDLSVTGDYLALPIRMGIKKYSLNLVNEDSIIANSTLTDKAAMIGASLLARRNVLNRLSGKRE